MEVYKLFWDEFSSWFLEIVKPEYKKPIDRVTFEATREIFDSLLRIIHPFMPFITEEIWQKIKERREGESIMVSAMPEVRRYNRDLIARFDRIKEIVSSVRTVRKEKQIPAGERIVLMIRSERQDFDVEFLPVISRLCKLADIKFVEGKQNGVASFMAGTIDFYIPLGDMLDVESEREKILADLEYYRGFLESVMKKLNNERFVKNAPANVLELEKKKRSDTEQKIKSLSERLQEL